MKIGSPFLHWLPRSWAKDSEYTLLRNLPEQAEVIDQCGYDYLWATEHHFLEEYSHSSPPEIFLAACEIQILAKVCLKGQSLNCSPGVPA
ncbi:MAG: hypothetical protein ABR953_07000 [Candidatus Acidiferrales bacterium]|jgi:hypothetical protein